MKIRFSTAIQILFCIVILLSGSGCGGRSLVRGKVIDDETGKPIKGAVFAIHWRECRGNTCFGLLQVGDGTQCDELEKADGMTDAEGNFEVPKHSKPFMLQIFGAIPTFDMGVYRKGFVMWSDESIIYPERYVAIKAGKRSPDDLFEFRTKRWELNDNMVVRLRPWKEGFSELRHAVFACDFGHTLDSRLLDEAVRTECNLKDGRRY